MKALVLEEPSVLAFRDVAAPVAGPGEVVVEVRACGICGSDVHGYDGTTGRRRPPLVMGHEAAGVIREIGEGVDGWMPGDRVTFGSTVFCGTCPACEAGATNLCAARLVLGAATAEHRLDGAFAELVVLPARMLVAIPAGLPFEVAAFAEPLAVAAHAVALARDVRRGSAVVVGTGVIGLLVIQVLRREGFRKVIGIDPVPGRLELAARSGATHTIVSGDSDPVDTVRDLTGGEGADVVFEAVGVQAAIDTALGSVRRGGTVVLIGNLTPSVELPLQRVVTNEVTLIGSCASACDEALSVKLLASEAVEVDTLLSVVAPLEEGAHWFEQLHRGEPGLLKVILVPNGGAS